MKSKFLFLSALLLTGSLLNAEIKPSRLTCEYLKDPQVIDVAHPRLSWVNLAEAGERGQFQTAREIRVASTRERLLSGQPDLWNSGRVMSEVSFNVPYEGRELTSRQECWWQVRVWDKKGKVSDWSEPAFWCMGLLSPVDWKAKWIGAPWQDEDPLPRPASPRPVPVSFKPAHLPPPAPLLRKSFTIEKEIASARAFVTGLGFFEFYVNGKKIGDDVLVPNTTLYSRRDDVGSIAAMTGNNFREYRVMYLSYDITSMLTKGENVTGAIVGNGFYNPQSYWCQGYGTPRFLGQIHIRFTDGTEEIITSDETWKAEKSPVVMDLVYDGEHYDARFEQPGWSAPAFDDSRWQNAILRKAPDGTLQAHSSPADKVMESLPPVRIEKLGEGHYKVDFGEEISGWIRLLNMTGEAGRKIDIKYICESAMGANSYSMRGGEPESYAARFTWFVFREAEISNWPGELRAENLRAEAVYSDVETTGRFESSNSLFNTINKIWWRSQTDNMHGGIASDCPHRERSPYTGDGQVACVTVMHNLDARAFYTKWIRDIYGAQNPENGYVPNGAPWQPGCGGGVGWGAAMNIMPWEFYLHYGDIDILRNNYEGMKGYIRYMLTWTDDNGIMHSQAPERTKPNRWINLGDWVAPGVLPPDEMVHTFFLWRCSDLTAKAAGALGLKDDETYYNNLAEKVRKAFHAKFFDNEKGSYGPAGGNIFALKMGVPDEQRQKVINALVSGIKEDGDHLDTGIFGTQFFFEVLSEYGLHELAFRVMNQRTQPSYGWWIEQGATTSWEKWDGTNSRNHPMFGGGIVWFYRKLAGMNADPENPGYRHIIFRPQPAEDIDHVSYSNLTQYGEASISWKKEEGTFTLETTVPVGSTATVYVPVKENSSVKENGRKPGKSGGVKFESREKDYEVYSIGSGSYSFKTNW